MSSGVVRVQSLPSIPTPRKPVRHKYLPKLQRDSLESTEPESAAAFSPARRRLAARVDRIPLFRCSTISFRSKGCRREIYRRDEVSDESATLRERLVTE